MNPLVVAPSEMYAAFAVALVSIVLGSYILIFLSLCAIAIIFWYSRGAENIVEPTASVSVTDIVAPCDGTVTNVYCDIQRLTHIEIAHSWHHRHGIYSMFDGEIAYVITEHEGTTRFHITSEIGRVDYMISNHPRVIAIKGDKLQKGDLLCFVPYEATISIVLPVYQSSVRLSRHQDIEAGEIIGTAEQVWSL